FLHCIIMEKALQVTLLVLLLQIVSIVSSISEPTKFNTDLYDSSSFLSTSPTSQSLLSKEDEEMSMDSEINRRFLAQTKPHIIFPVLKADATLCQKTPSYRGCMNQVANSYDRGCPKNTVVGAENHK
ncbi:hypothetical protein MKW94_006845, partial [Papaver nudicaule]|nr:hypothetical protein [Papaver nudicaule]